MDEKKLHTLEVQLMGISGGNMNLYQLSYSQNTLYTSIMRPPHGKFSYNCYQLEVGRGRGSGVRGGAAHAILCQNFLKL